MVLVNENSSTALRVRGVSKAFGPVQALRNVSMEVARGEVHALVGENGAGKSTLIKIITGAYKPDEGQVEIGGQLVTHFHPTVSKHLGVAAVYQQPTLFPDLTVAENLAYGVESSSAWRWIDWKGRKQRARQLLERIGANINPDWPASALSMPQQQLVEIARAVGSEARLIIMDEPTASLNTREVEQLMAVIQQLRSAHIGIIYVSHRLEELATIAQRVTVLRDGAWVDTRAASDVSPSELIRLMVGREISAVFPKSQVDIGQERLKVESLSSQAAGIHDVSLTVRAGEIVGLGGLMGAGRTELAQVLFGICPADSGSIQLDGQSVQIASPADAIGQGLAYVPEDRRRHGVIPEMPIAANVTLGLLDTPQSNRFTSTLGINFDKENSLASQAVETMKVKSPSIAYAVETLSGGNQQKVALGRWLATNPRVLILDEPTQGIDVGAKSEIHRLMSELAGRGLAILLISSEILELLGMCDRIAVMREGTVSGTLDRKDATAERIMELALP